MVLIEDETARKPTVEVVADEDTLFSLPPKNSTTAVTSFVILGTAEALRNDPTLSLLLPAGTFPFLLDRVPKSALASGTATVLWLPCVSDPVHTTLVVTPPRASASRHNCPARPDVITNLISTNVLAGTAHVEVLAIIDEPSDATPVVAGIARAFPQFSAKTSGAPSFETVKIKINCAKGAGSINRLELSRIAEGIQLAGRLVDEPCLTMHTNRMLSEIRTVRDGLGSVSLKVIQGEELRDGGFGGLWHIGKSAENLPALAILSHTPQSASKTIVWVGKGIMYDTGGLSIKGKDFMPGMKRDMGGSAALLGAFQAAVKGGATYNLHAAFCLAENAVAGGALRPDDIITLYSGKTVEVNNTDAEGRLVLGDGVAYVAKHLKPDVIIDMATLTGAQAIATGQRHGAVVCNNDDLEDLVIRTGKQCGDLVHPLPYVPEFYQSEFKSAVADMKNSVKRRNNAQASCAAQFINSHLPADYTNPWLHIDMAAPASDDRERATGYGVALLVELSRRYAASK